MLRADVRKGLWSSAALILLISGQAALARDAGGTAYVRALAETVAEDDALAAFYRERGYEDLWTGADDAARRGAALAVFAAAPDQGLPAARYDAAALIAAYRAAETEGDRGRVEAAMSRAFLAYARDVSSGVLTPNKVDPGIVREIVRPDPAVLLRGLAASPSPARFLRDLVPAAPEYARLVKEKLRLETNPGWGEAIAADALALGATGPAVVQLRNQLISRGYLVQTASASYDRALMRAVQRFQADSGIVGDGQAGPSTIAALNVPLQERLKSVVVALERLRWMGNAPRGARHIWVNQPDFVARIVDNGRTTFQTRVVIGKNVEDQRSPEFSDEMEYMVVNPSWGVPRSIIVKEYLPLLQQNSNAVGHLQVVDRNGRVVPRGAVNFAAYSASSFPFGLRQPPSDGNALGKVKFMFPNQYNIYLHDTPAKNLFESEVRAYSHGCIRLGDPIDFAHVLLARQTDDPKGLFQSELDSAQESSVSLDQKVPVHLVYFTAWPSLRGQVGFRADVYGRDARLYQALTEAGVVLGAERG
ncbi:L,D-transpeptidase family protein [Rhodobacteraceae bacterium KMS-5]|uniref:L,D-transpeptidase family protein n=1 Tax=Tabrizicola oligotrophica TaxID=2710650 RepID=A0A6M0QNY7_9RHOB|nr:L,D-transpeptidase family protein [Tabrizicola oligotrophica]